MASFYIPGPIKCNRITSFSSLSFSAVTYNCCNSSIPRKLSRKVHAHANPLSSFSYQSSIHRNLYSKTQRGQSLIAFDSKNSESEEDDDQALDSTTEFGSAFQDKTGETVLILDVKHVTHNVLWCISFALMQKLLELFSNLMSKFANNIYIVVKPTLNDGMNVGVQWKFEWNKVDIPLGKGFSLHISHTYHGKAVIRNIEMFIGPLIHLEPLRLKMKVSLCEFMKKIRSLLVLESGNKAKRISYVVVAVLSLAAFFFFMKLAS
ncbi:hypothetical protein VNO77_01828 [Canavalia gladiata]|uniref:Transmembrane protein n=1 Tax=Canavalia gladiata TaxID=3824 RepID=A0AAN9MWR0_CANGL